MVAPDHSDEVYRRFREQWEQRMRDVEDIYGDQGRGNLIATLLKELEAARLDELIEEATVKEAVTMTGFSEDTILRAIDNGQIRKVSGPGGDRVRVAELPFRAGRAHPAALRRRLYAADRDEEAAAPKVTAARFEPVED